MEHYLRYSARHEHSHGWVNASREAVHNSRSLQVDFLEVFPGWPRKSGGVGNRGNVQKKVSRAAHGGMDHHRTTDRGFGENVLDPYSVLAHFYDCPSRVAGKIGPDVKTARSQGGMRKGETHCLGDSLGSGSCTEELATPTWGRTRLASKVLSLFKVDQPFGEACTEGLNSPCVFTLFRGKCDPAGDDDSGQVARKLAKGRDEHRHRGEALVASRDSEDSLSTRDSP